MNSKIRFVAIIVFAFLFSALPVYAADLTVSVNASSPIRTIPETMYGANLASWDGSMGGGNTTFNNLMKASGNKYFRIPGGSWGNSVLWSDIYEIYNPKDNPKYWRVDYNGYLYLMNQLTQSGEVVHPTLQPIVNFPGCWYLYQDADGNWQTDCSHGHKAAVDAAAGWVQDQSFRAVCAQYWEIGNEIGGPWECGYFPTISGTYYGDYFADFVLSMKSVNPNIKIGACAEPTNNLQPYGWYQGHWDHDTLVAARAKSVVPDFFIIHSYQNGGGDGGASNNPTLLGSQVDQIAQWTSNMNSIVQSTLGAQYVGQIGYFMTEWNTSATDTYDRPSCYVNAMFRAQYILEMAKNNWIGANPWIYDYDGNYWVFPAWYIKPMLINKFGRNMVATSSSNSTVRAYSSIDANDNLTMFLVNNSPTTDLTAQINISGMTIGSGGQQWIMQPAGNMKSGGLTIQDYDSISINGTVHPDPLTINSLAPQTFTSGSSFTISLPKSCMIILQMPSTDTDTIPPAAPTGLTATPSSGVVTLDWNDNTEGDLASYNVYRSTTSGSGYIKQNNLPVTGSNYTDCHVVTSKTYYYIVRAVDTFWNESVNSNQASIMLIDTTPPAVPSGFSATGGNTVVSLDWNDNIEPDMNGYYVYRSNVSGGPYARLNSTPVLTSAYNDISVTNDTRYYYVVTSVDKSLNESSYSVQLAAVPHTDLPVETIGLWVQGTTHAKESGNNRALVFIVHAEYANSGVSLNSVTYGGQTMTKILDQYVAGGSNRDYVAAYILNNAGITAAGSTTFSPSWTGTPSAAAYSSVFLQNVNQTTLTGTTASATATTATITTAALSNSNGDMVVDAATCGNSGSYTLNNSFIESTDQTINSTATGVTGWKSATGLSETPSATFVGTINRQVLIGFVVKFMPNIPPAAPGGLWASGGVQSIVLAWLDNTEIDMAGYNVYRSTVSGGPYVKLNSSILTDPNYNDTDVSMGTTYYYVVTAVDFGGLESEYSGEVSALPGTPASGTGSILREWWNDEPGDYVYDMTDNDPNYPDSPNGRQLITKLEGPTNWADNYGERIRGYLNPVTSGHYSLWIASSTESELVLSMDTDPTNIGWWSFVIEDSSGYPNPYQWDKFPTQRITDAWLEAGYKYYIEVRHKAGVGDDHLAVAWEGPGITRQVIDGIYLSPFGLKFVDFAGFAQNWGGTDCSPDNDWCSGNDFNRDGTVDVEDLITFADNWLTGIDVAG